MVQRGKKAPALRQGDISQKDSVWHTFGLFEYNK